MPKIVGHVTGPGSGFISQYDVRKYRATGQPTPGVKALVPLNA